MIPKECEKCIHCRVCAYNNPKRKRHCDFYEESRPTGEWIRKVDNVGFVSHICSECGAEIEVEDPIDDKFCFNCGANMREGGEE